MDGLYGAIIVEPDLYTSRPFHLISKDASEQKAMMQAESQLQALLLGDYTHMPFEEFDRVQSDANAEILCMDSIIVNGRVSGVHGLSMTCADRARVLNTAYHGHKLTT